MIDILFLCAIAFFAGFIDSVVGGGGLIQIPALLIFLPDAAAATIFGTNKIASISGTTVALRQYAREVNVDWQVMVPAAMTAFLFSLLGARIVTLVDTDILRPVILILLIAVTIYTFFNKNFGTLHAPKLNNSKQLWVAIATGAALGFYDGFFGPGAGSFLIFIFISIFGFDFLSASASSKIVNIATNLSAILYFAFTGHILFMIAIPMAICNIGGSIIGAKMAILKGSQFVRVLFLVTVSLMILRFAYDVL